MIVITKVYTFFFCSVYIQPKFTAVAHLVTVALLDLHLYIIAQEIIFKYFSLFSCHYWDDLGQKKIMSVSSDMSKNIRVGRSEKSFFLFFFFKEASHDQTFFPTNFASFTSK